MNITIFIIKAMSLRVKGVWGWVFLKILNLFLREGIWEQKTHCAKTWLSKQYFLASCGVETQSVKCKVTKIPTVESL